MNPSATVRRMLNIPGIPMTFILIAAVIVFQVLNPIFLSPGTMDNFLTNAAPILLLTLGVAIVIVGGGIDLSVGTVAGLSAGTTMVTLVGGAPLWAGVAVGALTGLLFGLLNGFLVAVLRIDDFIATLATLNIAAGLLVVLSQAAVLQGATTPGFAAITRGDVFGIPISFVVALGLFLIAHLVLSKTVTGRRLYAIGVSAEASNVAGVSVPRVRLFTFVVSGLLAGVAGVLLASRLGAVQAFLGIGYEFTAIAGAVVGGIALAGGIGNVWAALIGGLFLLTIQQGLRLNNVDPVYFSIVTALAIVFGVVFDRQVRRVLLRGALARTAAAVDERRVSEEGVR
ncbi:ABC transporter permease [Microbacterium aurantiacum]|uniref:ABC transporter permease n=1 Tax=Microbacterium aurantiacum TaxID=162393 RepID=UPI003419409B